MKKIVSFDKNLDFKSMIGEISSISLDHTLKFEDGSNVCGEFIISGSYKLTEASRLEESFEFKVPVEIILSEVLDVSSSKIDIEDFNYHVENDDTLVCHIEVKVEGVEEVSIEEEVVEVERLSEDTLLEEEDLPVLEVVSDKDVEDVILERECDDEYKSDVHNDPFDIKEIEVSVRDDEGNGGDNIINDNENENIDSISDNNDDVNSTVSDNINSTIDGKKDDSVALGEMEESSASGNVGSLFSSFKDSDETFSTYSVYILRSDETIEAIMSKYKVTKEELENYNDLGSLGLGSKVIIPTANERD